MAEMAITKKTKIPKTNNKPETETKGGNPSTTPLNNKLLDPEYYRYVNIKTLLKNSAIDDILHAGRNKSRAWDLLAKPSL